MFLGCRRSNAHILLQFLSFFYSLLSARGDFRGAKKRRRSPGAFLFTQDSAGFLFLSYGNEGGISREFSSAPSAFLVRSVCLIVTTRVSSTETHHCLLSLSLLSLFSLRREKKKSVCRTSESPLATAAAAAIHLTLGYILRVFLWPSISLLFLLSFIVCVTHSFSLDIYKISARLAHSVSQLQRRDV